MKTKKSEFLQIRLSSKQKKQIRLGAQHAGTDMSSWILSKVINNGSKKFLDIVDKFKSNTPQSYVFSELHDLLMACSSFDFESIFETKPDSSLTDIQTNYLTAMVEHRAHQIGADVPTWCNEIEKLNTPFFASNLKNLRVHLLISSPTAFRRRNIFIDSSLGDRV